MTQSHSHTGARRGSGHGALWKDAWRAIAGNGKRFAAIAVICAVGVMMMGALSSISNDLRAGLDGFFDDASMRDVSIVSTLGFDDDYLTLVSDAQRNIETIRADREQARTDAVKDAVRKPAEEKLAEQRRLVESMPDGLPMKTQAEPAAR